MALGVSILGVSSHVQAATISNTATLRYDFGGVNRTIQSNPVSFSTSINRTASAVSFLRALPGNNGKQFPQQGGQCKRADGSLTPIALPQQGNALQGSRSLQPAVSFNPGEVIYIQLIDGDQNIDPLTIDTIELILSSSMGDSETLQLYETGIDTGIFAGGAPTNKASPAIANDCQLSIDSGTSISVHYVDAASPADVTSAQTLVDPYGKIFDSLTGALVDGARITLVDDASGIPASVLGDDGVSAYPSSVVSGATVTDGGGTLYPAISGAFRFPFVTPGRYRIVVEPPTDYIAPSTASRQALAQLVDGLGMPFVIEDGSFGLPFAVTGPEPLQIDIPVDRAARDLTLEKVASTAVAESGDFVHYRLRIQNRGAAASGPFSIIDDLPAGFRYKPDSVRSTGASTSVAVDGSGERLTFSIASAPASGTVEIGYTLVVGPEAAPGNAVNRAAAMANGIAASNEATATVRVRPPFLTDAATIIGRISEGQCGIDDGKRPGVNGVRLLMEDGTYVISDHDGRYHFEGVAPGLHVVQVDVASLPAGYALADCIRNTRRGGRDFSTFVELSGGALWRADFVVVKTAEGAVTVETDRRDEPIDDATAAGANTDWMQDRTPAPAILFPLAGHNPRAPAQRFVVKHTPGTKVVATINGVEASPLAFDGTLGGPREGVVISRWRALPLSEGLNVLIADIRDANGKTLETLSRKIWFVSGAAHAEVVADKSALVADGRTRPVIAVRLTDASGRPIRGGSSGNFRLGAPYVAAAEVDTQQERQLAGLDARPTEWHVRGDDGIAFIELAPTTQTGTVTLGFDFQADRARFTQEVQAWLSPGDEDWIVVGYAAGTTGFNTLRDKTKLLDKNADEALTDGQVNFYAKGRILGKWLMTLAYDDDRKQRRPGEPRQLLRTIDPDRYYTVYGDGTEQRYDAPTSDKLYLKLERAQFYALYGDFETGLTRTELTRYSRTVTGMKTEYRSDKLSVNAFAADTGLGFGRDEIQGNGLSGPYRLSRRNIVSNSEKVVIEVRDRFQSQVIVSRTPMTRHVDYDVDTLSGTLLFRAPVTSRDADLNPQFIVVEYETEGTAAQYLNAGGRAAIFLKDGKVEAGASFVRDADNTGHSDVGGIDVRIKPRADTEIRVEAARSERSGTSDTNGEAYIGEVEHHGERLDLLAYFRQQDAAFGVGQQNASQSGTRKYGVDGSFSLSEALKLTATAYREEYLVGPARRNALDLRGDYRRGPLGLRGGLRYVDDHNQNGDTRLSELLTFGASHEFLNRKLVIDADAEVALGGKNNSADFPSRYRIGARYALTDDVRLIVSHEIADGDRFDAQTTEIGFDVVPWKGGRLATTLNQRGISESGQRTFAALGLTQSLLLGEKWGLDLSFDSNSTIKGSIPAGDVLDANHPVSNGGFLGTSLTEDFWALSAGATYRHNNLSWNGRVEYRDGDQGNRYGFTTAVLRQIDGGIALAASGEFFRIGQRDPVSGDILAGKSALLRLSAAYRPESSRWSLLDRLDFNLEDVADGALPGPFAFTGGIGGKSRRVVNNLALNLVSRNWIGDDEAHEQRAQLSLYWGAKYVLDRYEGEDFGGFAEVVGIEARRDIGEKLDIGLNASIHHVATGGRFTYSIGPNLGASPFDNAWISVGYNIAGYEDRDFSESRYTRDGPYATFRLKFDQMSPESVFGQQNK